MKKKWILFLSLVCMVNQPGFTKTKGTINKTGSKLKAATVPNFDLPLNDNDYYEKFIKEIKKSPRSTAAAETDVPAIENNFEKDFLAIRDELIGNNLKGEKNKKGITTVNQLDQVIEKYSNPDVYKNLSNQSKFVALQLRSLKPFKSFIFRAKGYIGNISATRTLIVTMLRNQIAGIQSLFPVAGNASVNHWELVFDYVTTATPKMGPEILTDQDLYVFFTQLTAEYANVVNDFKDIVTTNYKPIWWDNKLYMSFASFTSEKDRYILLGKPELYSIYSTTLFNLSTLLSTTAYSFDGLQSSIKSIGQLFGVDKLISTALNGPEGMSSYTRVKVLKSHPNLFVLTPQGKERMERSYDYLKSSVRAARVAYEETKKLPEGSQNLFDPRVVGAFSRVGNLSFSNVDQLVSDELPVSSAVLNGERVKVSLKNFYYNPPEKLSDLYPTDWDLSWKLKDVDVPGYKHKKQRNYKYGMATEWRLDSYQNLFPELKGHVSNKRKKTRYDKEMMVTNDLPKYARILSQTWGASAFAVPLSAVIF
ncbi:MAG: hypothetical protein KDD45_05545 [Bdellovibrionales bacterium]|nr:hypothetical protein [Bdellovibrionales bacterium]